MTRDNAYLVENRRVQVTRSILLAGIFAVLAAASFVFGQPNERRSLATITVDDPRPVAKAIEVLEARYGWVITYEDPPFTHESDVTDVTQQVRRDLDQFEPGKAPRVLIPKGGVLEARYAVANDTDAPIDPDATIQSILDAHGTSGHPGSFRLEGKAPLFHVVPTSVKGSDGRPVPITSILDVPISLLPKERSGVELMEEVCAAVGRTTHSNVVMGTVPTNLFAHARVQLEATDTPAREVLLRGLAAIGGKLSWQILYDPGLKLHVVNVALIAVRGQ